MKRVLKKNRLMITILAAMVAAAGYLNYNGANLHKENAKATTPTAEMSPAQEDIDSLDFDITDTTALLAENQAAKDSETTASDDIIEGETVTSALPIVSDLLEETQDTDETAKDSETTTDTMANIPVLTNTAAAYVSQAKLIREQVRSKNKEMLEEIINNKDLSEQEIKTAVTSLAQLTDCAQKELAAETLLEAQGYENAVVSMTGDTVDVVVDAASLDETGKTRIEDAVKRKTGVSIENIVITPVRAE